MQHRLLERMPVSEFRVRRYDFPSQFPSLDLLTEEIRSLLLTGNYVLGPQVSRFEQDLAAYLEVPHVVGVNSGTDALVLALHALGIGPGDEVITVANTFHATVLAIARVGATPVLVDCRPDTFLMNLDQVSAAVTARTKAILVVHMFGQAVDMSEVLDLARSARLRVVEDCCQSIGARSKGVRIGTQSDAGCWSFAPTKNLAAAGDGGAISLADADLAKRLRLLRHFGQEVQNEHQMLAFNSRLDSVQAIVLRHKLPHIDGWNRDRARLARLYQKGLADAPVTFQQGGVGPGEHVYHLLQIRTPLRDQLLETLQKRGVDAIVRYPTPIHLQPAFFYLGYRVGAFPVAESLARETICLPAYPGMPDSDVTYVCDVIRAFFASAPRANPTSSLAHSA